MADSQYSGNGRLFQPARTRGPFWGARDGGAVCWIRSSNINGHRRILKTAHSSARSRRSAMSEIACDLKWSASGSRWKCLSAKRPWALRRPCHPLPSDNPRKKPPPLPARLGQRREPRNDFNRNRRGNNPRLAAERHRNCPILVKPPLTPLNGHHWLFPPVGNSV